MFVCASMCIGERGHMYMCLHTSMHLCMLARVHIYACVDLCAQNKTL